MPRPPRAAAVAVARWSDDRCQGETVRLWNLFTRSVVPRPPVSNLYLTADGLYWVPVDFKTVRAFAKFVATDDYVNGEMKIRIVLDAVAPKWMTGNWLAFEVQAI